MKDYIVNTLKNELRTWKRSTVGLDIETHTAKIDEWKVRVFEIGLYNPRKKKAVRILINPNFFNHLHENKDILRFYKPIKYKNIEGFLLTEEQAKEVLDGLEFKTIYGHNVLAFDLPHLIEMGINIKAKTIFDSYLLSGNCLPLKYYTQLTEWHKEKMRQLEEYLKSKGLELGDLTDEEKKQFFKFFTEKGNLKFTAESIYCFISGNPEFKESHTAVEDCIIEYEIYKYMKKRLYSNELASNWIRNIVNYFERFKATKEVANDLLSRYKKVINKQSWTYEVLQKCLGRV